MKKTDYDIGKIRTAILRWLGKNLEPEELNWLESAGEKLQNNPEDWFLYPSFSAVPRHTGKKLSDFSAAETEEASDLRTGWKPSDWSADQLGRVYLVLSIVNLPEDIFIDKIEKMFVSSDMGEAEALYKGLPLYPYPEKFKKRAAEGIRSNMTNIFNAIAHNNPYPSEYFDEGAWNQIVLKALFVESPLYKITGIDDRANETLARILVEYAHERWSAGREISPELWRPAGPFIDEKNIDDLKKSLNHPEKIHKQAAILALLDSNYPKKNELLNDFNELVQEIGENGLSWVDIGKNFENN